jgi:hypothetical protein
MKRLELAGQRFGRLAVLSFSHIARSHDSHWNVRCDCGKEQTMRGADLKRNAIKSCGCSIITHGHAIGRKQTKEYRAWRDMKTRCYNPHAREYKRYGDRGIYVSARYLDSFDNFLADMGMAPSSNYSIDRINNGLGYIPGNLKWSTAKEQAANRRRRCDFAPIASA